MPGRNDRIFHRTGNIQQRWQALLNRGKIVDLLLPHIRLIRHHQVSLKNLIGKSTKKRRLNESHRRFVDGIAIRMSCSSLDIQLDFRWWIVCCSPSSTFNSIASLSDAWSESRTACTNAWTTLSIDYELHCLWTSKTDAASTSTTGVLWHIEKPFEFG